MLDFEEFMSEVETRLRGLHPLDDLKISFNNISKNNNEEHMGMTVVRNDEKISPVIYMEYYYDQYKNGTSLAEVVSNINTGYEASLDKSSVIYEQAEKILENPLDNIYCKIVNKDRNIDLQDKSPCIDIANNLMCSFRVVIQNNNEGFSSCLLINEEFNKLNISKSELFEIAKKNTKELFQTKLVSLDEYLRMPGVPMPGRLLILTNRSGVYGASAVLDKEYVSEKLEEYDMKPSKIYLIPSSVHELLIVSKDDMKDVEELVAMVKQINATCVTSDAYLSDSVYELDENMDMKLASGLENSKQKEDDMEL